MTQNPLGEQRADSRPADASDGQRGPPSMSSSALFKGARELMIEHQGVYYTLRITRNGKLILTK